MNILSYRDLQVWQRSMDLVVETYKLVKLLPSEERFALGDQLRRAVVSIPSNIAEGHGRNSKREFRHFLSIAMGSKAEVQTQILICERLGYMVREQSRNALLLSEEVGKMLYVLQQSLNDNNEG